MNNKKAIIFGGTGFIGRQIVKKLAQRGYTIGVVSRYAERVLPLKPFGFVGQIAPAPYPVDFNAAALDTLLSGADVVVNLLGILFEKGKQQTFQKIHVDAAGAIGAAATRAKVSHFVHVSALGASAESASVYAQTKAAGEAAVRGAYPGAVILRPSVVFGSDDNFFNQFARLANVLPILPLIGGGLTRFQPVYVGDVADAVIAGIENPKAAGQTYSLGGTEVLTFKAVLERMLKHTGQKACMVRLPWTVANFQALIFEQLPKPMLTRDQILLLESDSIVPNGAAGLVELGITPHTLDAILPTYLESYRKGGRWAKIKDAAA
ncbi:MAG: complex I NDUFA9 subunit family protein [Alphaproteobacteria bacterium]|nr:complex I NDUFA9 subunit family protein [Alphaproteobacteria bacterium]